MNTLKRYLTESKRSVKGMLNFISKNQNFIHDYQLSEIWENVAKEKFQKDTGFYPTTSRYKWQIPTLAWELEHTDNMSYEDILNDFKKFQGKSSFSPQEQIEKTSFTSLLQYAKWDGKNLTGIGSYDMNSLLRFLRYIVYNKLDKNLAEANKIMDDMGWSYSSDFRNEKLQDVGGITMSKLKNGKIIIKGLNRKQIDNINRISGMTNKWANV
jgi:hypothetical protein